MALHTGGLPKYFMEIPKYFQQLVSRNLLVTNSNLSMELSGPVEGIKCRIVRH
jgi:hypothetical protein